MELSDAAAKVEVKVDGNVVDGANLKQAMTLPAGLHRVDVASDEFEDQTWSFVVRARQEQVLRIPLVRKPPPGPPPAVAPFAAAVARQHQEAWSKHLKAPVETTNSIGMKLVLIPAGEFMMGSPDSDKDARPDEKPRHRVRITKPFWLGAHEVTVGQYRQFAQAASYSGMTLWQNAFPAQTDEHPVVNVSWDDANAFCKWLSAKERKTYRLPTEAEWEYACRAGTTSRFCFGESEAGLEEYAWYFGHSGGQTHPVGQKRPNAWALYDMHGNVWEYCADCFDSGYYATSRAADPTGPGSGAYGVARGGSSRSRAGDARSANRLRCLPGLRYGSIGLRVAMTPGETGTDEKRTPEAAPPKNAPKPATPGNATTP
jgi:formylglycine-generating enzyme required for sulfatase activity